ncbi:MAG: H(+)-transporting ATPase [Erysipelotrichaceae bacterium]|nr:H(+)-transporting ATPase [Erysipelotrichaceae bacterium]
MLKRMKPVQMIILGFLSIIFIGSILLVLPITHSDNITLSYIDALFTSVSAVCVTGLVVVDTSVTFNAFGKIVIAILIQIGGLGVVCMGESLALFFGRHIGIYQRQLIKESWNVNSYQGLVSLVKMVLRITFVIEGIGALLSLVVFIQDYSLIEAIGISIFHAIAAFNNAGFDIIGSSSLIQYQNNIYLNIVTAIMIILGGIGFMVMLDAYRKKDFHHLSLQSKAVITTTTVLIFGGMILLKCSENISWIGAFFQSVTARTAGFATYNLGDFSNAGLMIMMVLMFIGASSGSTGGGLKTNTIFVVMCEIKSTILHTHCTAFKREINKLIIQHAFALLGISLGVVLLCIYFVSLFNPELTMSQVLFESVSAFSTTGLSTGITSLLSSGSKIVLMMTMFTGRVGAWSILTIGGRKELSEVHYSQEDIMIG